MGNVEYRDVRGHIEVYMGNHFLFSADTKREAEEEYRSGMCLYTKEYCKNKLYRRNNYNEQ